MKLLTILSFFISAAAVSGCVYRKEIVRPDEIRQAISFSSESSRDTFTCTINSIERRIPTDKKQQESTTANFLILNLYTKDYFLSENAYFNYIVAKTDTNRDSVISKEEAIGLYKSYFPNDSYIPLTPGDGYLKRLEAMMLKPHCDIHA